MEILVVEDEAGIADFLARGLESEGYGVTVAADGVDGRASGARRGGRPRRPRPDASRAGRARGTGCDPPHEALAAGDPADGEGGGRRPGRGPRSRRNRLRDQAVCLRRAAGAGPGPPARLGGTDRDDASRPAGSASICSAARRAARRLGGPAARARGRPARLPDPARRARVCTYAEILAAVWGYDHDPGTNVVQVYVGYLRRKLDRPGSAAADRDRALGRIPARAAGEAAPRGSGCGAGSRSRSGRSSSSPSRSSSSPSRPRWDDESDVIKREEAKETRAAEPGEPGEHSSISPI